MIPRQQLIVFTLKVQQEFQHLIIKDHEKVCILPPFTVKGARHVKCFSNPLK